MLAHFRFCCYSQLGKAITTHMRTIATFSKPEEAHLFRTRLEAAEIPAFVLDENFVQLYWLYSNAIGGVRVQVAEEDVQEAREFLAADSPQVCADSEDVVCPFCESLNVAPDEWPRRFAYFTLLVFHFPILLHRHRWRCAACDHVFHPRHYYSS